ncbi:stage II sporulation protein P [Metabacillus sediminilitoris]|uniref:Stage II sporulation protein P n=1 Tax=Metabacillus sediminilitoris TaxID=2567941 RepID=A0A4S4BXZ6_9BACI|nr:stage II sporulation protein P [Metabacillus sediminilitoris]QGQ44463.1 stage II sporulation protein P [Metabacillus sediminilitoris]THF80086.1 stage II sporulation protein P [Metabacillus sediminilitoris]
MNKQKEPPKFLFYPILGIVIIYLIIIIMLITNLKVNSSAVQNTIGNLSSNDVFAHFLRAENHYFYQKGEEELFTLSDTSRIAIQIATNVKPTDARTFLGSELPGLRLYDTEIVVAGEGTDLTTLPHESAPPTEVLLQERKVAEEILKEREDHSNNEVVQENPPKNKTVYIYQTHSWESFLPLLKDADIPDEATSNDERANVIGLGQRMSENLINKGIGVVHDTTNMTQTLHEKGLRSTKAYAVSGDIVQEAVSNQKNDLNYFIDIHRDSARRSITTKKINGRDYARLYFVVGKEHKNYLENLETAKELHKELEKKYPGISRGVFLKSKSEGNGVYNQDISDKAMLVEIGGVDNNLNELDRTVDAFTDVFADYYWKSNEVKEVNGNG